MASKQIGRALIELAEARGADITSGYAVKAFTWAVLDEATAAGVPIRLRSCLVRWCREQTEAATHQTAA